jgi:hypothetical protein
MPALPFRQTLAAGLLVVAPLILSVALPGALSAQTILTISPQQCVWHAGDDPAWAAPNLDETGWQPYANWRLNPAEPRIWIRCHADLSALRGTAHLALQASVPAAYELYGNGQLIGGAGNLRSGNFSMNTIRLFPIPQSLLAPQPVTLAARITYGYPDFSGYMDASRLMIQAGDQQVLEALHDAEVLARVRRFLNYAVSFGIIGVLAFVVFGLFLFDRTRRDLLLLGIYCLGLAAIYMTRFFSATLAAYPVTVDIAIYTVAVATVDVARTWIVFVLAGRRMPLLFWIPIGFLLAHSAATACGAFLPLSWSLAVAGGVEWTGRAEIYAGLACTVGPFVAFWPYTRIRRPMIPIAALCIAWGAFMMVFFASGAATFSGRISKFASFMVSAELVASLCVIVLLMGLLLLDQKRTARERAELAGEMTSAREIQQYLIPEKLPDTPGLAIQSVYLPAREVGGDFFQVLPDARDGSTLIVVGDVAGKGLKAGMLSALIVGAIRTAFKFTSDPGAILALLNERLQGRGLVTCLAMRIDRDGSVELANAGHLPPYIDGKELAMDGALPLGALPDVSFPPIHFQLHQGEPLLLVSDGVVEARNKTGELFGFDRMRQIGTHSAEEIARAAQAFGQEDDITVLTLTLAPVAVAHA